MQPHVVDTNILLRIIESDHVQHQVVVDALSSLTRQESSLYVFPQNVREFWNVCTRPQARNGLGKTPTQASADVVRLESAFMLLEENAAIYQEWRRLVVQHQVSGVQVHDANLAAAMHIHGITHILTFNGNDFARYLNIVAVDPAKV